MSTYDLLIEEGIQKGRQEGRQEGVEEGNYKTKVSVVLNGIEMGFKVEEIAKLTSLSPEEVAKIIEEHTK